MDIILNTFLTNSMWMVMFNFKAGEKKIINIPMVIFLMFCFLVWQIL